MSHRQSTHPTSHARHASTSTSGGASSSSSSSNRARQYAHLHAALAQLNAHLADTDNLLRMTAVQAEYMRGLGGWTGGLFMAAAKVLGEETTATTASGTGAGSTATTQPSGAGAEKIQAEARARGRSKTGEGANEER